MLADFRTVVLITILLSGCNISNRPSTQESATESTPSPEAWQSQVYECDDYEFSTYGNSAKITLYLADRTVTLDRVRAASGVKYRGLGVMFWNQGNRAMLEVAGKTHNCQNNPQTEPRIDRGKRPVNFRATGNEPGWLLEIVDESFIRILTDYGNNLVTTPAPSSQSNEDTTIYEAEKAHNIRIVIQHKPCMDTMSGDKFNSKVRVDLDGEIFIGCGQRLS